MYRILSLMFVSLSAVVAAAQSPVPQSSVPQSSADGTPAGGTPVLGYSPKVVIPRAFDAITEPNILSANKAGIAGSELVLGVTVNGESRAYPINQLTGPRREIINDTLGGTAIAATW